MSEKFEVKAFWGKSEAAIQEWTASIDKKAMVKRIWDHDASLWTRDAAGQKEAAARLGWLHAPDISAEAVREIVSFADEIKNEGIRHCVLLGMGGSSLAPELFQNAFGNAADRPAILVLDSTDPLRVKDIESQIELEKTLFIVSSKSGGTIELVSFFKYFYGRVSEKKGEKAGKQFIAITDPGTPLAESAKKQGFRKIFLSDPNVGGRFSALTPFGLVPAALIGVDIQKVLESARQMARTASAEAPAAQNPAVTLGVGMAVLAEEGRDKLTLVTSAGLESFGDWAEQLVAESTGKEGMGVVPVVREKLGTSEVYGEDRFFVALLSGDDVKTEKRLKQLADAGHPVLIYSIDDKHALGAEFFRWEMATAIACALLKVNAFDQPDVQSAKEKTKAILKSVESGAKLEPRFSNRDLGVFWDNAEPGDYAALLVFLPDRPAIREKLETLRIAVRDKTKLAVTLGFGPRYLHSTGQLHKGGPNNGIFLLVTAAHAEDLPISSEKYGFVQLELAQAMGDFEALESKGRWVHHVRLNTADEAGLDAFCDEVKKALETPVCNS